MPLFSCVCVFDQCSQDLQGWGMFFHGALFTLSVLWYIYSGINITCVQPIMQSGFFHYSIPNFPFSIPNLSKSEWSKIRSWHYIHPCPTKFGCCFGQQRFMKTPRKLPAQMQWFLLSSLLLISVCKSKMTNESITYFVKFFGKDWCKLYIIFWIKGWFTVYLSYFIVKNMINLVWGKLLKEYWFLTSSFQNPFFTPHPPDISFP